MREKWKGHLTGKSGTRVGHLIAQAGNLTQFWPGGNLNEPIKFKCLGGFPGGDAEVLN